MFNNIWKKIKGLAIFIFACGIIASVIIFIYYLSVKMVGRAFLYGAIFFLASWASVFTLYGLGHLIENSELIKNKMYGIETEIKTKEPIYELKDSKLVENREAEEADNQTLEDELNELMNRNVVFKFNNNIKDFESCSIPSGTLVVPSKIFFEHIKLKKVSLPQSLRIIKNDAFNGCIKLKQVNLPSNLSLIDKNAFKDCKSLNKIFIPNSVKYMGENVFKGCESLKIYCEATSKPITWNDNWNSDNLEVIWGYVDLDEDL